MAAVEERCVGTRVICKNSSCGARAFASRIKAIRGTSGPISADVSYMKFNRTYFTHIA